MSKKIVELVLNEALASALVSDPLFRSWFLGKTRFADRDSECILTRADNPWTTATIEVPNPETGKVDRLSRQGETDVLAVFKPIKGGPCFAVHIENKLAHSRFTKFQIEGYAARAEKWVGNPHYGNYHEWQTILLAPDTFRDRYPKQVDLFGVFISHEDVSRHLPAFSY